MAVVDHMTARDSDEAVPMDRGQVDTLMRRFFDREPARTVVGAASGAVLPVVQEAAPRRDFDMASGILDRASQAFDLLINRCQRLERDLDESSERARVQAAEQGDVIEQWKRLATGLKAQLDVAEGSSTAMKQRCDAAEARAAMAEQRASMLERASVQVASQAALAESLSTKLHDKVVSAFGIGSRAHPVLEAVATQAAAE